MDILYLIMTLECNMSCEFCFVKKKKTRLNIKKHKEILKQFLSMPEKNKKIIFFGGEPLIAFENIKKLHALAKNYNQKFKKNVEFCIPTNGLIQNPKIARFLKSNKFTVGLSLNDLESVSLAEIKKRINFFQPAFLQITVTPKKMANLSKLVKQIIPFGTKNIIFNHEEWHQWGIKEWRDYKVLWANMRKIKEVDEIKNKKTCSFGKLISISPDGRIFPCPSMATNSNFEEFGLGYAQFKDAEKIFINQVNSDKVLKKHVENRVCFCRTIDNKVLKENKIRINSLISNYEVTFK